MLKKGQIVRFNARGLRFIATARRIERGSRPDWTTRTGTIGRITRDRKRAYVLWDGNTTLSDAMPLSFLDAVEP